MAPKTNPVSQKKTSKPKTSIVKLQTQSQPWSLSQKRFNPFTAYTLQLPSSFQDAIEEPPAKKRKGKEKARDILSVDGDGVQDHDDRLWVDLYEPTNENELAVHVKKVEDVRRWLLEAFEGGSSGRLTRYRRILVLTGPPGAGKTTTVRVLSQELGFEILEWRNVTGDTFTSTSEFNNYEDYESSFVKFANFFSRATSCRSLFSESSSSSSMPRVVPQSSQSRETLTRQIILLEDLPNILHPQIQASFHAALRSFVETSSQPLVPLLIILSDATIRGESRDELLVSGGSGWTKERGDILDIRTVLPKEMLGGPFVTQISFNPIAPTLMKKALSTLISRHFSWKPKSALNLSTKEMIDLVVGSANGDIRSAIMTLQFSCISKNLGQRKKRGAGTSSTALMETTRRESSLALFHLVGKVLYNKRSGDPPSSSASAKDIRKEKQLDEKIKDPVKLPNHLKDHERRASRVNIEELYADSPIDSSLFSLYIHQNYTQFCNEVDECGAVIDWLSWIDSSGGEMWYQANPHRFHLLTLGTLHSLPSPVPRRSQKIYKPDYFDYLSEEKDAWDALQDVQYWMVQSDLLAGTTARPRWTKKEIVLQLGGILKTKTDQQSKEFHSMDRNIPPSHHLFSKLIFTDRNVAMHSQVDEEDLYGEDQNVDGGEAEIGVSTYGNADLRKVDEKADDWWKEIDDIEEI